MVPARVGFTISGAEDNTIELEPVVAAAARFVPLPVKIPLIEVPNVIAGVVVALATVPVNPLADTTETEVTVPEPPPKVTQLRTPLPSVCKTWLAVPSSTGRVKV